MKLAQQPRQGAVPVVDAGVGVSGLVRTGDVGGQQRLATQVQPRHVGRKFGNRAVMLGQIIDKYGSRRAIFRDDALQGRPLWPKIGIDLEAKAMVAQLAHAVFPVLVADVGQHHHIGMLAQRGHGVHCAGNGVLAVHLGIEEGI